MSGDTLDKIVADKRRHVAGRISQRPLRMVEALARASLLLAKLKAWDLERKTLVIFMTDNGHPLGSLYNAGMRSTKATPTMVMTHCRTLTATSPVVAWLAVIPACLRMITKKPRMELIPVV